MPKRILVIGERFNMSPRKEIYGLLSAKLYDDYWDLMLRLGAFRSEQSRRKLASIAVPAHADTANLLPPESRHRPWLSALAREVACDWWPRLRESYDVVILCGLLVAKAFQYPNVLREGERLYGITYSATETFGTYDGAMMVELPYVMPVPRPSSLCRWWDDPDDVEVLRERVEGLTL